MSQSLRSSSPILTQAYARNASRQAPPHQADWPYMSRLSQAFRLLVIALLQDWSPAQREPRPAELQGKRAATQIRGSLIHLFRFLEGNGLVVLNFEGAFALQFARVERVHERRGHVNRIGAPVAGQRRRVPL